MKLKLKKPSKVQWLVLAAVAVVIAMLVGNMDRPAAEPGEAGRLDDPARQACDVFDDGYRRAESRVARLSLADRTVVASRRTGNDAVSDRAGELGRASDDDKEWKGAGDALLQACRDAGWTTR